MRVFLVGFSGSGKTSVGPILAKLMGFPYLDTDKEIERRFKTTISAVFAEKGEVVFRDLEYQVISDIVAQKSAPVIVGLGGGAFVAARNRTLVNGAGVVVYLRCELSELYHRLSKHRDRPLLFGELTTRRDILSRMRSLLRKRRRYYAMADITVSTTWLSPQRAAKEIQRRLKDYGY